MTEFAMSIVDKTLGRVRVSASVRRSRRWLLAVWLMGVVVLAPFLAQPTLGIALVAVVVALLLAWRSVAYPLAAAGIPSLVDAIAGSNPLPKGGFTFIFSVWIAIAVAFSIVRRKNAIPSRVLMSVPVLFSFGLLGLMLLRLGPSPAESYGSMKVQLYVADVLLVFVGAVFAGSRRADLDLFLLLTFAILAAGALLFLVDLVTGNAHTVVTDRFSLTAEEYPIYLARDSADGLLIAIYLILATKRRAVRLWAVVASPALVVALIAAGSRGPMVAFAVGLLALITLVAASGRARRRLAFVAGTLLISIVVVPLVVPGSSIGRALSTLLGSSSGLSSNGRSELWSLALTAFNQHPLLGIGWGGFDALSPQLFPHNILLEVAAELGIVGAIVIVCIIGAMVGTFVKLWRISYGRDKLLTALLVSLFLTALVNASFSGAIQDNSGIWLWGGLGLGFGTAFAARRGRAPAPNDILVDPVARAGVSA